MDDPFVKFAPMDVRFWSKVDIGAEDECWPWVGGLTSKGYGSFAIRKDLTTLAHRIAYELVVGPVPSGLELDHLCHSRDVGCTLGPECPHRRCQNPAHLEPVPHRVNAARAHQYDRAVKGRWARPREDAME